MGQSRVRVTACAKVTPSWTKPEWEPASRAKCISMLQAQARVNKQHDYNKKRLNITKGVHSKHRVFENGEPPVHQDDDGELEQHEVQAKSAQ